MRSSHPREAVKKTPVRMAMGAARAAFEVSSDICAAESSADCCQNEFGMHIFKDHTARESPHWRRKGKQERPSVLNKE
jgi:hypothetical protein